MPGKGLLALLGSKGKKKGPDAALLLPDDGMGEEEDDGMGMGEEEDDEEISEELEVAASEVADAISSGDNSQLAKALKTFIGLC